MIMSTVDSHVAARLVADSIRHDECMWHAAGGMVRGGDGYLLTMCMCPPHLVKHSRGIRALIALLPCPSTSHSLSLLHFSLICIYSHDSDGI